MRALRQMGSAAKQGDSMAIWNLGSINIDRVYRLDHLPAPGETIAAREHVVGLGGKGANQSVAAARAGAATRHIGAMGTGDDWVLDRLQQAGVDCTHVARLDDAVTGHAVILVDVDAENSIVIHPGANRALTPDAAALDAIAAGDILLIQNETNAQVETAEAARARGARVIYSAAPFDLEALRAMLPHADILAMNEGEARAAFDAFGEALPVAGLLITRGADGAEYRDLAGGQTHHQPAFRVTAIDTTGAGDCFAGYFAAGMDAGLAVSDALRRATAAAAIKVTRAGAGDAIPTAAEVDDFLKDKP